ncbi:unnamed protein product [marine sediment metagenome]|uniref:Uncharacterized protein n=1 Tax=marine sediment metagenome TaxID=412755 RepID=X1JXD8_9ZZZZ
MEGREKSDLVDDGVQLSQESRISHTNDDSKDSFYRPPMWGKTYWNNSIDAMDLSPEQRKYLIKIMRKEVKS